MKFSYCPKCGKKLDPPTNEQRFKSCADCKFVNYQNPIPTASAIIVKDEKILLGKRKYKPGQGMWDLPGGFMEIGELPEEATRREVLEETGLKIKLNKFFGFFLGWYDYPSEPKVSTINICYLASIIGGTEKPDDDLAELEWFNKDEVPIDKMAFENNKAMIRKWQAQSESGKWPIANSK